MNLPPFLITQGILPSNLKIRQKKTISKLPMRIPVINDIMLLKMIMLFLPTIQQGEIITGSALKILLRNIKLRPRKDTVNLKITILLTSPNQNPARIM